MIKVLFVCMGSIRYHQPYIVAFAHEDGDTEGFAAGRMNHSVNWINIPEFDFSDIFEIQGLIDRSTLF
jgi:hypothetical protein